MTTVLPQRTRIRIGVVVGLGIIAAGFALYAAGHPLDFRVYHYGARRVFGGGAVYGVTSGLGWPQHYRYPPLFLPLFAPIAALPLPWGAALWAVLKVAALALLTRALWRKFAPPEGAWAWWAPLLIAGPYVVEDLRFGNAQSLVFALTAYALLRADGTTLWPAAALGLAINLKVWPLFFLPCLVARRRHRTALWAVAFTAAFALLPAISFGFQRNLDLLSEWFRQEFTTQTGDSEIWFPSQSLRGVMMRYLTFIDYSRLPDGNYPLVHIAELDPALIRALAVAAGAAAYAGLLILIYRRYRGRIEIVDGLAFALLPLVQPFTQKYALVVLLWPAIVAGRILQGKWRAPLYAAGGFALVQPLIPGSWAQRSMQAMGFDFAATALLAATIALWLYRQPPAPQSRLDT
ncbi:MAG TPA: glycosyltransferase family 87 protein [Terriglobia bacterium]|nr:glycosyltransferase family 87 protein [Terriglobia bacterium]